MTSVDKIFASKGVRDRTLGQARLGEPLDVVCLLDAPLSPILSRLQRSNVFDECGTRALKSLSSTHTVPAKTAAEPFTSSVSAGKNTYTYDAHTYHTKVPPQGIARLIDHYLPEGGLVLDPFSGSGMTGVAARALGVDCILNELSPAACFISDRFTASAVSAESFKAALHAVLTELEPLRKQLYSTKCRECDRETELLYCVWSYRVLCGKCDGEFQLWDACRKYGKNVKEHKILSHFPCPLCKHEVRKSSLKRTVAEPVLVGYKCCGSKQVEVTHPPSEADLSNIEAINSHAKLADGYFPETSLPDGVNLRQPKKHGLTSIDKFYTKRNLVALSHLWKTIHRIESLQLAAHIAFVFTSLYQRVTRMSEFRFWGGSGNTAHFNVPYIFDEPNVFLSFSRKARTILDHLVATASVYKGRAIVVNGSATSMSYLDNNSVDFIFTDPPFGANINYSEMNILWESWLGSYTNARDEAIISRVQGKDLGDYQALMTQSLRECYRVLRDGHWLLLVFMNSSGKVWESLRSAISDAGFAIKKIDTFDKQHGTFKQFTSENTAGMDVVLHCQKTLSGDPIEPGFKVGGIRESVASFIEATRATIPTSIYLHVSRAPEIDYRTLYSDWLAKALPQSSDLLGFAEFRELANFYIERGDDATT